MVNRARWLSLTPEPERELPRLVATLAAGRLAGEAAVAGEAARLEAVVLRGSERLWLDYLESVLELIDRRAGDGDREVARARARAAAVLANHHQLLMAVSERGAARTAAARERLAADERRTAGGTGA